MTKKRQSKRQEKETSHLKLKDGLNNDILQKLQEKQRELQENEEQEKVAVKKQLAEERKQREKNKSFEELLNETSLNWKDYK
ncbi:YqkE family protein [Lederbergia lenta]|uniref:Acetyltransferase, GNAT family n=1 Tax=Lederbergia lenta TaxID=1467 RepID=A0A2X4YXA2_LEDLE|nr:YqkE family protein [Lederbergia lenta]MEC2325090.1 YqkE family protein [Lederbergia lenta]SQI56415.1 acetyltransferase, GNAT family [Lederbergia lenta]